MEDEMSIHRFNWALTAISKNDVSEKDSLWIKAQIENWQSLFSKEASNNKIINTSLKWSSYTIGERISNIILFHYYTKSKPPINLQNDLFNHVDILSRRLEYFKSKTGNHIINNARALYLFGISFKNETIINFAKEIFRNEIKKLISKEGFLREGSSHYQFIFTRWIIEIYIFSNIGKDRNFQSELKSLLKKLMSCCNFFYVTNKNERTIPLFGDISPDFIPNWIINLDQFLIEERKDKIKIKNSSPSWVNLEKRNKTNTGGDNFTSELQYFNKKGSFEYKESGWYRYNNKRVSLFIRQDKMGFPEHVGHHHHDFGHFVLYIDNKEIFIDSGRENYLSKKGVFSNYHNTIEIDSFGALPKYPHRYPTQYSECRNLINSYNKDNALNIEIESDGFSRLKNKLTFNRKFTINENNIEIIDNIYGGKNRSLVNTYFYLDGNLLINKEDSKKINLTSDSIKACLEINSNKSNYKILKSYRFNEYGNPINCKLLRYEYLLSDSSSVRYKLKF